MTAKEYAIICKLIDKNQLEAQSYDKPFDADALKEDIKLLVDDGELKPQYNEGKIIKRWKSLLLYNKGD